jgi:hypothetical protein
VETLNLSFKVREFLRTFPTTFEYDDGDTGFFVDIRAEALLFLRAGVEVDRLPLQKMLATDPEGSFEIWRRQFARTEPWRPGRDRDD